MPRKFEDYEASTSKSANPLLIGITSPSFGGKTYSALRLATGIQRVVGGDIFGIDTEANRMLHYKDRFKFRHLPFSPPHNPASYQEAIEHCLYRGAKIIIVDSMTHEHSGDGGVLDMIEEFLDKKAGEDFDRRDKLKWTAQIRPKAERKRLNNAIQMIGSKAVLIFCYRADDKTKPVSGGKPIHIGWQAETTSKLPYEMTVRFLLPPASDGHPSLNPDTEFEKLSIKMPEQFRDWFKPGLQLNEDLGEKLARWSVGTLSPAPSQEQKQKKSRDPIDGLTTILSMTTELDAEGRILAKLGRNHRTELTELDIVPLVEAYKILKADGSKFDSIFPVVSRAKTPNDYNKRDGMLAEVDGVPV